MLTIIKATARISKCTQVVPVIVNKRETTEIINKVSWQYIIIQYYKTDNHNYNNNTHNHNNNYNTDNHNNNSNNTITIIVIITIIIIIIKTITKKIIILPQSLK